MALELAYNLRHLMVRRVTSLLTLSGVALVVFVFVATLMLAEGLRQTLASTGRDDNVIVLRTGAQNEIQSGLGRDQAAIILAEPEVAKLADGTTLASADMVILVSLKKRSDGQPSNVNVRGVGRLAGQVRNGVQVIQGRAPVAGTLEVMVGRSINEKFSGTDLGSAVRIAGIDLPIVGIFDGGGTLYNSEIWGDGDILIPSFKRDRYSSLVFRLAAGASIQTISDRLERDPRLSVDLKSEKQFYADQSKDLSMFITYLGSFVSIVFSLGAIVGAMITMYSAVANRTREIGVLRALGFPRSTILLGFVKESLLLALVGGVLGVVLGCFMTFVSFSTMNFGAFSEIAFGFAITPLIAMQGLLFAVVMGVIGGLLPALRASKLQVVNALRAV